MKKGFTLMEVLTVVVIVGILTAIAIPRYSKVMDRARFTKAEVMAKSLHESCERYVAGWGVEEWSAIPNADNRKISKLDIGSTDYLPPGFSLNDNQNSISGAGFLYQILTGANDPSCAIRIVQQKDGVAVYIDYDGTNLVCHGSEKWCDIYGVDYVED